MSTAKTTAGIRRAVFEGRLEKTPGSLRNNDLKENNTGKIVSKAASLAAKKNYRTQGMNGPKGWVEACKRASDVLGYWETPMKKGSKFHRLALKHFKELH